MSENKITSDLLRGHTDTMILRLLCEADRYGYEIVKRIAELSGGAAFSAEDSGELDDVYKRLGSQIGTRKGKKEITSSFAAGGLLLLVLAVAGSLRWRGRIP